MRQWNKVIEIGPPKTGTSSLGQAFKLLGLRWASWNAELYDQYQQGDYTQILETAQNYDAFEDAPWHCVGTYKQMDQAFPNSKFILLERDLDSWVESYINHFSDQRNRNQIDTKYLKSDLESQQAEVAKIYLDINAERKAYFKDRPEDLLIMNICAGEGWETLCPFLELPIPKTPFPRTNVTPTWQQRLKQRIRQLMP
ncbi:MAG: sulfotransferase family protein [Microcoleaceae cyanobacterium]